VFGLLQVLLEAAAGRFPPDDGLTEILPAPRGPCDAVVGFTAHHIVAADLRPEDVLARLPGDDIAAAMDARFLAWLAERLGTAPGMIDAVLAADPLDAEPPLRLAPAPPGLSHGRIDRASAYRTDLRVFANDEGSAVMAIGRGLAGRLEVTLEIDAPMRDAGLGRALIETARILIPAGEPLFAQVTPGNARSLRAFLAAGFRPIGSEVLFLRQRSP
jgi:hypothetical protein